MSFTIKQTPRKSDLSMLPKIQKQGEKKAVLDKDSASATDSEEATFFAGPKNVNLH
jgi:hypothetical protein